MNLCQRDQRAIKKMAIRTKPITEEVVNLCMKEMCWIPPKRIDPDKNPNFKKPSSANPANNPRKRPYKVYRVSDIEKEFENPTNSRVPDEAMDSAICMWLAPPNLPSEVIENYVKTAKLKYKIDEEECMFVLYKNNYNVLRATIALGLMTGEFSKKSKSGVPDKELSTESDSSSESSEDLDKLPE